MTRPAVTSARPGAGVNWVELTPAELRVLKQTARGLTAEASAEEAKYALETVKGYRSSIIRKLGARNMVHAVSLAHQRGLLDDEAA